MYHSLVDAASCLVDIDFPDRIEDLGADQASALYDQIRPVLDRTNQFELYEVSVPVELKSDYFHLHSNDLLHLRNLFRAFRFAAELAASKKEYEMVAQRGLAILHLANAVRRGGLIVDHLLSSIMTSGGVNCLRSVRADYPAAVCRFLIDALLRVESHREPFFSISQRDAKWETETGYDSNQDTMTEDDLFGQPSEEVPIKYQNHLLELITDAANQPASVRYSQFEMLECRDLAGIRLLAVDLAVRCWREQHGQYPHSISELSPNPLPSIPPDPFTGDDFVYRPRRDSFSLYSTGPSQTDSGGKFGPWYKVTDGGYDLGLDSEDFSNESLQVAGRSDPPRRVFGKWFTGYFLVAVAVFAGKMYDERRKQELKQLEVDQKVEVHRDAVRRGETGDAFRRLFPQDHQQFLQDSNRIP